MAEDTPQQNTPESRDKGIDLSSLQDLALGPNWSSGNTPRANPRTYRDRDEGDQSRRGGGQRRDRRGPRPPRNTEGGEASGEERRPPRERRDGERRGNRDRDRDFSRRPAPPPPFRPTIDVALYPEEAPFKALTTAIRTSGRTFELFEIARLILEKPERFVLVLRPLAESEEKNLYVSVPDNLPFETEAAAVDHVFSAHADKFFEVEEVEVDPPKGNFVIINRCGITGELLGPPNYHRYQQLLQLHFNNRLNNVSWERFTSRIESVRDAEAVNAWMEKMRKQVRYRLKDAQPGTPTEFDSADSARHYLVSHQKDRIVREAQNVRLEGKSVDQLPEGSSVRRSVEGVLDQQRRFPLDTANNLRGRLRRMNFNVYKKGAKGISYVCAIRRRFRKPDEAFGESVQQLVEFIEAHPNYPAVQLPKEYLGIEIPEAGETALSEADQASLRQLRTDLRWLTTSGYVTEYSDGRLFAPPPRADGGSGDSDDSDSGSEGVSAPVSADESDPAVAEAVEVAEAAESAAPESSQPEDAAATPDKSGAEGKSEPDAPNGGEQVPEESKQSVDQTDAQSEQEAIVDDSFKAPADEEDKSKQGE